ncbi:DUF4116 domain-containing protein [Thalassotalea sp. G20_0]|uniref:DUF4116 domain-containing protein n=1 Tax=Thalassotalea sp. G20_0 TaxID=2821093 RepID=UPI001ADCEF44|nr:DUF4116 domain-containing protein [Thalassotalea sp. G20_0]MBO9496788.1 DUF4116 domain-containing protein [Thalassotalea sp. G20_0]
MFKAQSEIISHSVTGSGSTCLPGAGGADIANGAIPVSGTLKTHALSSNRKCETSGIDTTFTPSNNSTGQKITETFALPLKTRRCTESQLNVDSPTIPNRKLLGGKGMFLTLMKSAGLAVPPFRCIETSIVQNLEALPFDASPLLAMLDDGHEFPHATATLVNIRQWITQMAPAGNPSGNPTTRQQRWLDALSSFIAGPDFYQQISALPIADQMRTIYKDLRTDLAKPDSPIIVRSSGVAEDAFGNAQAGKYQSQVHDQADIVATCLKVLASAYRSAVFSPTAPQGMAIILQQCIQCCVGGVGMSYRGIDDGTLLIECGSGQPKTVVSGQYGITPHGYEIKRNGKQWEATFKPGNPEYGFILRTNEQGGYEEEWVKFEPAAATAEFIGKDQLSRLVEGGKTLEDALLCPVDFEFAIDPDGQVLFLQGRPITCLPGGSHFSMASPPRSLDQGTVISDGCGSGLALAISGPVNGSSLPDNVILFCDHGGDWLLAPEVLKKTKGVVFNKWANNDHISISLRQEGIPCVGIKQPQWWPGNDAQEWVTLVCGKFQKESGGFLLPGDREQALLNFSDKSATADYQAAQAAQQAYQPAEPEKEPSVARLFSWLVEQNTRLLDFLGTERLIHLCLSKTGVVQLSMHPERQEIVQGCVQEIDNFMQEIAAFLSGYERFLMLGAAADPDLEQQYHEELTQLREQLALVQTKVKQTLAQVTRPFLPGRELLASGSDFQQWLAYCQLLKDHLQRLEAVNQVHNIESVHELILWLHKCFLTRLWPVATASGQGEVSTIRRPLYGNIEIVDFSTSQEEPLFDDTCREALREFEAPNVTVLNMPGSTRFSIQLGHHACTIDLLEQADGGKQRTFRMCYAEALAHSSREHRHGKFQRLWFLTQTLSQYRQNSGCSAPDIHFNGQAGQILFEFTHLPDKKDLQRMFVDILSVLQKLSNTDFLLGAINLDESQTKWSMAVIRERLNNPAFCEANQFALEHVYWCYTYIYKNSLINHCTQNMAIRHLAETALIFSKAPINRIEEALNDQLDTYRQKILWHWLLFDPAKASPLVNKYVNWLADETMATRLVSQNGHILKYLAPELRNQRTIVFAAIKSHPEAITGAPECFKNDIEIIEYALANTTKNPGKIIAFIGTELSSDPVIFQRLLTTAVENTSLVLSCNAASEYLEQHPGSYKKLLLLAMERNHNDDSYRLSFKIFRKNLLNDHQLYRQLILKFLALKDVGSQLEYFPDLNNDREVVYTAVGSNPFALAYVGLEFQADKALVKEAVGNMGRVLEFASEGLKDDEDIVLAAVKNKGVALEYASERLRADPTIVTAALKNSGSALAYAARQFRDDPNYLWLAVSDHNPTRPIYQYLNGDQCKNKELCAIAVSKKPENFQYLDKQLRNDQALAQLAVQGNGEMLRFASETLCGHEGIVRLAVQQNGLALEYATPELRANKELVKLAVQNSGMALKFASDALKGCPEVVKLAVQENPQALHYSSDHCRNDPELANIALQNDGNALMYIGRSLQSKPEIISVAVNYAGPVAARYYQQAIARKSH